MTSELCYWNGRFLSTSAVALPLDDLGFASGSTIVDNARTYGGSLFRWPDHLARFRRDCERCYVPLALSDRELTDIAHRLLAHNLMLASASDLHVVTVATPGTPHGSPTLSMTTYPIRIERYRPFFTRGVTLAVAGTQSFDRNDLLPPTVKHRSRLHWHIAEQTVRHIHPHAVPVVMNRDIGDTSIGGIVAFHKDNTLLLPPSEFVQESISLKVLREFGVPFREEAFSWWSVDVRELLLCGTGFGIAAVCQAIHGERTRAFDWPGPMYRKMVTAWSELVGVDIERQFTQ